MMSDFQSMIILAKEIQIHQAQSVLFLEKSYNLIYLISSIVIEKN